MSTLLDSAQTSSTARLSTPREAVATGFLVDAVFGTNAGVRMRSLKNEVFTVTTVPLARPHGASRTVAKEVSDLRDAICAAGLNRQMIARLLGVDRRSLSGWASGEIRPTSERLAALQTLARVVAEMDAEHPSRAADVVGSRRGTTTLLDAVAAGRIRVDSWRSWLARSTGEVTVTGSRPAAAPIWAAAARAAAEGRLTAPTWERTLHPEAVYEMHPDQDAGAFAEPEYEGGRRGYQ